tara:strand:- start:330 stop:605 length:276 start_codon:yes stop_codon:yes gene_type:complete
MILEEINSFFVNDERETIEVEFTITEENSDVVTLEILFEELQEVCDLFEDSDWYDAVDEDDEFTKIQRKVNTSELKEGLEIYINRNVDTIL